MHVVRADYVLVWEESQAPGAVDTPEEKRRKRFRERFIQGLTNEGVAIEKVRRAAACRRV